MELTPIEGAKPETPTAPAGFKAAGRRAVEVATRGVRLHRRRGEGRRPGAGA